MLSCLFIYMPVCFRKDLNSLEIALSKKLPVILKALLRCSGSCGHQRARSGGWARSETQALVLTQYEAEAH